MPKPGVTSLMKAAVQETPAEIVALLKAGADINAEDSSGWTAQMYAAQAGKLERLKFLPTPVRKRVTAPKQGRQLSLQQSHPGTIPATKVNLLKAAGTDINAQDKYGTSTLMIAA